MTDTPKPSSAKPTSSKVTSGRVTPKANKRYTPPVPPSEKKSGIWVPIAMFSALGLGVFTILANYVDLLPGDGPNNTFLLIGLGLITVGFIVATRYH